MSPRTLQLSLSIALVCLAGGAPPAAADLRAKWVGQSDYVRMEGGDIVASWFDAKNIGSETWESPGVRLGTSQPQNRASAFYDPDLWVGINRPALLDQASVAPGQIGRFTFKMHAPRVTEPTVFREAFEPLWEFRAWMGGTADWPGVYLDYTVLPAESPKVTITSSPARVTRGEPIVVVADAQDNLRVAGVRIQDVDGTRIGDTDSYRAELSSASLPVGSQPITVRATDPGGRETAVGASVEVVEPKGPNPPPASRPAVFDARITSTFVWKGTRTRFTSVRLVNLPRAAKVLVTCEGRGCPVARRTIKHSGSAVNVLKALRGLRLRSGARLQIRLADGGATKAATWRIRKGRAPQMSFRCASAGEKMHRCS